MQSDNDRIELLCRAEPSIIARCYFSCVICLTNDFLGQIVEARRRLILKECIYPGAGTPLWYCSSAHVFEEFGSLIVREFSSYAHLWMFTGDNGVLGKSEV